MDICAARVQNDHSGGGLKGVDATRDIDGLVTGRNEHGNRNRIQFEWQGCHDLLRFGGHAAVRAVRDWRKF